ncbi:MAG: tetratricopeptide repeat protein, partial [Actinomycetota bacterium]
VSAPQFARYGRMRQDVRMGAPDASGSRSSRSGKPGDKSKAPYKGKPGDKSKAPYKGKPGDKSKAPYKGKPGEKSERPARPARDDLDRPRGPRIPDEITGKEIDRRVAAELRTLPEGLAEQVARLLVAASMVIDEDPQAALVFAQEAKRKAARIAPVREAVGVAAYAAGDFAEALSEFRALRRMTGDDAYVPVMADCERGLGRPRKALELLASVPDSSLAPDTRVESRIVAAGARRDLGQPDAALLLLQGPDLTTRRTEPWLARLRYAYADTLLDLGRVDEAATWFARAMEVDLDAETDAADRLAELQGVTFGDDWEDDEPASD